MGRPRRGCPRWQQVEVKVGSLFFFFVLSQITWACRTGAGGARQRINELGRCTYVPVTCETSVYVWVCVCVCGGSVCVSLPCCWLGSSDCECGWMTQWLTDWVNDCLWMYPNGLSFIAVICELHSSTQTQTHPRARTLTHIMYTLQLLNVSSLSLCLSRWTLRTGNLWIGL